MTPFILALFIFLAVIFIVVGIAVRRIVDLEERVNDLELCRMQLLNDMTYLRQCFYTQGGKDVL